MRRPTTRLVRLYILSLVLFVSFYFILSWIDAIVSTSVLPASSMASSNSWTRLYRRNNNTDPNGVDTSGDGNTVVGDGDSGQGNATAGAGNTGDGDTLQQQQGSSSGASNVASTASINSSNSNNNNNDGNADTSGNADGDLLGFDQGMRGRLVQDSDGDGDS